jgi:ABC-2 type transport system ATP-binding protein
VSALPHCAEDLVDDRGESTKGLVMRSDSDPVVHVEDLVKTFGATRALDGLDLDVRSGEVHGFLGPNGSGKSTTIRILLGLMRADSGRVTLFGRDPWRDAVELHSRLAYVPGEVTLWPRTGGTRPGTP